MKVGRTATVTRKTVNRSGLIGCLGSVAIVASSAIAPAAIAQVTDPHQAPTLSAQAVPIPPLLPPPDRLPPSPPTPAPDVPLAPPPVELKPAPPPNLPGALTPGSVPGMIVVQRFDVVGSTVFSTAELATVTAPYTKRPLSFAALLEVQAAITKLYTDQGYITSGAVIPPQTLDGDVVRIQVVEGELEGITVTGTRRLNPNYVRSRVAIATQKPLNSHRLLAALQLLQLNPLIKNLSAELSSGTRPGTNFLAIRVTEAKTFGVQLDLDNNRSPSVGTLRRGVQVSDANLLGQGDSLKIGYANTSGSNVIDFSYDLPINPHNGTLGFDFETSYNRIVEQPFEPLDLRANSRNFSLTFRQPLIETPTRLVSLGLVAYRRESDTSILGVPLKLSPGADANGRTRISTLRFFQDWVERRSESVFAAHSEFSFGISLFYPPLNDPPPDGRFVSWQGQFQWVRRLAPDTLLVLRSNIQLSNRALAPFDQFALGGQGSVRGYRQDFLLADNGVVTSAEVRVPLLRLPQSESVLQVVPFFDAGKIWNSSGQANPDPTALASIGLGLRWQQGDRLTFRLDWGIPLVSVNLSKNTWQENGVTFSLVYSPL